jgi:hypothetical protein
MVERTCAIPDCERPQRYREWCSGHYHRWQRYGDPRGIPAPRAKASVIERLMAKVQVADTGCWLWTAALNEWGYGVIGLGVAGRSNLAHRAMYVEQVGPIRRDLDLDHLCRVRRCVNPAHLQPVTRRVNLLRGATITAHNAAKTHCPQGHPYSGPNLMTRTLPNGNVHRKCRECDNARRRRS